MGVAADKFAEALSRRGPDIYVDSEEVAMNIIREAPQEKRRIYARDLLRAGVERSKQKGDGCIMLNIIPGIAKACPEDKGIIDICVNAANSLGDRGLRAAVLLLHNPDDRDAMMDMMVAMTAKSREFPNMDGLDKKDSKDWQFLDISDGRDAILDIISRCKNDKAVANRACQIMHNFDDISDPVRTRWTSTIVKANPGNQQVIDMAFAQADKVPWWIGHQGILSSIARANQDKPEVLDKIRYDAEHTRFQYEDVTNTYRSRLLALTCDLKKEDVCDRLIQMTYGAWNDAKIDVYSAILEANPKNEEIAMKILRDPFSADVAGDKNAGYTVREVFSKVLEKNPNNAKLLDYAVKKAELIKADPKSQGIQMIDEAIAQWTGKVNKVPQNKSYTRD